MGESSISSLNVKTRRRHSTSRLHLDSRLQRQFLLEISVCLPDPHDHMSQFLSLSFSLFLTFSILLFPPRSFLLCFPQISVIYHRLAGVFNLFSCPHVALKSMQCHIFLDWWFPILDSHVTWNIQILKMSNPWWWWFSCSVESNSCNPMDCSLQASLSMDFSRQEYWRGLPFPSPEDLPNPGMEPGSPALLVDSNP